MVVDLQYLVKKVVNCNIVGSMVVIIYNFYCDVRYGSTFFFFFCNRYKRIRSHWSKSNDKFCKAPLDWIMLSSLRIGSSSSKNARLAVVGFTTQILVSYIVKI